MSKTEIINEEPVVQETKQQTTEDKFFGKSVEIDNKIPEGLEVEVVDDTPEADRRPAKAEDASPEVDDETVDKEIENYSKRAADRIAKIKYEYHEERRAKEAAARESKEAITRLQTVMSENQKLQAMVEQGGEVLNKQAYNNALWAKQNAQDSFKKAYEEGNADEMSKAQELLSRATLAEQQSSSMAANVQQEVVNKMPVQPIQPQKPQLDPDMQAWSSRNPWFMGTDPAHKEMTSFAMYVDQSLQAKGVDPASKSQQYYKEVDSAMKGQFPNFFGVQPVNEAESSQGYTTPKRQPSTVVASASRDSGNKKPTQIRINQTQVKRARQLGISPEMYANQLLKES